MIETVVGPVLMDMGHGFRRPPQLLDLGRLDAGLHLSALRCRGQGYGPLRGPVPGYSGQVLAAVLDEDEGDRFGEHGASWWAGLGRVVVVTVAR